MHNVISHVHHLDWCATVLQENRSAEASQQVLLIEEDDAGDVRHYSTSILIRQLRAVYANYISVNTRLAHLRILSTHGAHD